MALSQLFWDVFMPWNLKSTYFSLKFIHFLSLNIWYVIYVVFWIKYWNLKLPHHCILFLFTICTVSQLFWNRVCTSLNLINCKIFTILHHPYCYYVYIPLHIPLAHPCLYYYLLSPQYTVLHILFYCTFYSLFFLLFLPIFIYILLCCVTHFALSIERTWPDLHFTTNFFLYN